MVKLEEKLDTYSLGIGLSSKCNFNCLHCYYKETRKNCFLSIDLLKIVMINMPRLQSVIIGLEGEPLLYPYLNSALQIISNNTNSINIVTNGSLLDEKICLQLSHFPITSLAISIESGISSIYEHIRIGSNFKTFIKNCENAVKYCGDIVNFHVTIFKQNLPSIPQILALASKIGIKNISFQLLRQTRSTKSSGICPVKEEELLIYLEQIIDQNEVNVLFPYNFASQRVMHFIEEKQNFKYNTTHIQSSSKDCEIIYKFTSILSDGSIFPCCGDLPTFYPIKYSFNGIFNHPVLQRLRKKIRTTQIPKVCHLCMNRKLM